MTHYDNPKDLKVGEDVIFENGAIYSVAEDLTVGHPCFRLESATLGTYILWATIHAGGGRWRRLIDPSAVIRFTVNVDPPKPAGSTCRRCKQHFEYAGEKGPGFVCTSCGHDGFGRTWARYVES